ncbi:hypothetical protein HNP84_006417 [Thermocatellispora tengchongensis]|uniref:Uncharacterized protein n=1 Tax=Thermocatellispora tengchongensis TaxID=1073253 RepID=A0A840PD72_9ACTN|nr:hypothetical protein [Thermocatellispora tengchongensis]MBB5136666.1 hypothetical protein [Thermocatellispora tengchongensis]
MTRRVLALVTAVLACLGALAVSTAPAQAASASVVEIVYSPLSLGDYCSAKVNSSSTIGFYNGSLGCYRWSTGGTGLTYTGTGSASAACAYFNPTYTYLGYAQGGSQALICRYSV